VLKSSVGSFEKKGRLRARQGIHERH
jgi:hypothetical protein